MTRRVALTGTLATCLLTLVLSPWAYGHAQDVIRVESAPGRGFAFGGGDRVEGRFVPAVAGVPSGGGSHSDKTSDTITKRDILLGIGSFVGGLLSMWVRYKLKMCPPGDRQIMDFIKHAFGRPAFQDCYVHDVPGDFDEALTDTMRALYIGVLWDRKLKKVLRRGGTIHQLRNPEWQETLHRVGWRLKKLRRLNRQYDALKTTTPLPAPPVVAKMQAIDRTIDNIRTNILFDVSGILAILNLGQLPPLS